MSAGPGPRATHVVAPEEAGLRIDIVVARAGNASRAIVADAIERGDVTLNGAPVKRSTPVEAGDALDFALTPREELVATPQAIPLDVVYEDDEVLIVNKPAGMVTHPAHGSPDGTLVNALAAHVAGLPGEALRPGLIHRLDRDTSGLLAVAKTERSLRILGKAMMRRAIEREYLGLVHNVPEQPEGTIQGAIGRDEHNRLKYAIRAEGRPAVTHYRLRETLKGASELTFRLETGRTHQIRVHMAAFGLPIINDPVYGRRDARVSLPGQALHAWRLSFRHPATGEQLAFEAEPPAAYVAAREALRR
jgi:23S rRNA pseudouridine1911/1915/1917 synthase